MKKLFVLVLVVTMFASTALAQDSWHKASNGEDYNCVVLLDALAAVDEEESGPFGNLADQPFVRYGSDEVTFGEYMAEALFVSVETGAALTWDIIFQSAVLACTDFDDDQDEGETSSTLSVDTFNVITAQAVNLRSCAGTSCSLVRQSRAGEVFKVVGTDTVADGEWYQIEVDDGLAFVAARLTTRGPDRVIDIAEPFLDPRTGCVTVFDVRRGSADLYVIISGDSRDDVVVDVFRPGENAPLRVQGQLNKTFIDTGDPYIHQYYSFNVGWPLGLYSLQLDFGGVSTKVAWNMAERGDYRIFVQCD